MIHIYVQKSLDRFLVIEVMGCPLHDIPILLALGNTAHSGNMGEGISTANAKKIRNRMQITAAI
jgi:hypothetical protein